MSDPVDPNLGTIATAIGSVVVAALGTLGLIVRRRQDRQEKAQDQIAAKGLSEKEEYSEIDRARREALRYYDLFVAARNTADFVQTALRHLVRKISDRYPTYEFDKEVSDALNMKTPGITADE